MDVIELLSRLYFIRLPVGHAYLWSDPDGLTLIDAGLPGSAPLLADAIQQTGHELADLRHLVLTHFHPDHIGAAADIAEWGEVEVLAHHADAPVHPRGGDRASARSGRLGTTHLRAGHEPAPRATGDPAAD